MFLVEGWIAFRSAIEETRGRAEVEIERVEDVRSDAARVEETSRGICKRFMDQQGSRCSLQDTTYRRKMSKEMQEDDGEGGKDGTGIKDEEEIGSANDQLTGRVSVLKGGLAGNNLYSKWNSQLSKPL